jgi:hypothetical protein
MPTGYTANIGKGISFQNFVLNCARAFGALVTMRDDPADAEIPDSFEPSDYHIKEIEKANIILAELEKMTIAEAQSRAEKDFAEELRSYQVRIEEYSALRQKYVDMLQKVNVWNPPTADHNGLKDFMVQQIESSINFDCSTAHLTKPKMLTPQEWISKQTENALWSLNYHREEYQKEKERCAGRTAWVRAIKESLK